MHEQSLNEYHEIRSGQLVSLFPVVRRLVFCACSGGDIIYKQAQAREQIRR